MYIQESKMAICFQTMILTIYLLIMLAIIENFSFIFEFSFNSVMQLSQHRLFICLQTAGRTANSVDPDQTPRSVASDLGLHRFVRLVCLKI